MSTIKLVVTAAVTTSSLLGSFTAPAAGPAHELTSPAAAVAAAAGCGWRQTAQQLYDSLRSATGPAGARLRASLAGHLNDDEEHDLVPRQRAALLPEGRLVVVADPVRGAARPGVVGDGR